MLKVLFSWSLHCSRKSHKCFIGFSPGGQKGLVQYLHCLICLADIPIQGHFNTTAGYLTKSTTEMPHLGVYLLKSLYSTLLLVYSSTCFYSVLFSWSDFPMILDFFFQLTLASSFTVYPSLHTLPHRKLTLNWLISLSFPVVNSVITFLFTLFPLFFLIPPLLSLSFTCLFSKMQSYKRAIGEVSTHMCVCLHIICVRHQSF